MPTSEVFHLCRDSVLRRRRVIDNLKMVFPLGWSDLKSAPAMSIRAPQNQPPRDTQPSGRSRPSGSAASQGSPQSSAGRASGALATSPSVASTQRVSTNISSQAASPSVLTTHGATGGQLPERESLLLILGTNGPRRWTSAIDQVSINHTVNDEAAMGKIVRAYKFLRGPLRLMFSIHTLDSCSFTKVRIPYLSAFSVAWVNFYSTSSIGPIESMLDTMANRYLKVTQITSMRSRGKSHQILVVPPFTAVNSPTTSTSVRNPAFGTCGLFMTVTSLRNNIELSIVCLKRRRHGSSKDMSLVLLGE